MTSETRSALKSQIRESIELGIEFDEFMTGLGYDDWMDEYTVAEEGEPMSDGEVADIERDVERLWDEVKASMSLESFKKMDDSELREALEEFYQSCAGQGYFDTEDNAEYFCQENFEYNLDKSEVIKILEEISRREEE